MKARHLFTLFVASALHGAALGSGSPAPDGGRIGPVAVADFDRLLSEIKPERGESTWREIPWLTNLTEARRRSLAEGKPLVIFTAADGSPLGRT
ncbi:MAG TPA: hypothetical protein VMT52_14835 [Planctomycetota bacterium]|nr:hypothetical protein [Planctomycetota bacterium]